MVNHGVSSDLYKSGAVEDAGDLSSQVSGRTRRKRSISNTANGKTWQRSSHMCGRAATAANANWTSCKFFQARRLCSPRSWGSSSQSQASGNEMTQDQTNPNYTPHISTFSTLYTNKIQNTSCQAMSKQRQQQLFHKFFVLLQGQCKRLRQPCMSWTLSNAETPQHCIF